MCLYPTLIENPKYKANKKNGGVIPLLHNQAIRMVPIGCQDCIECRKKKAREWQSRLQEDLRKHKNGRFVTFTFSDESIKELYEMEPNKKWQGVKHLEGYELDNAIATRAVRLFLERHRKKYSKSLRHWLVTEIGHNGTKNIHLHGIIWTDEHLDTIEQLWKYGTMWKGKEVNGKLINYVNERTVNYIVKYIHKVDCENKSYRSIVLTSAGIGRCYIERNDWKNNKFRGKETNENYRTRQGREIPLPIYWRNKIYTDEEREKLWIYKIEKKVRYVMGEKISIRDNEDEYYAALKHYQKINKQLGYSNGQTSWTVKEYERQRRIMYTKERISRAIERERLAA